MTYFLYRYVMQFVAFLASNSGFLNLKLNTRNIGLKEQKLPHLDGSIWVHCASLGEFEQGKILIDALRSRYPDKKLVLTFFSASGYDKKKDFSQVDNVLYLPYDTPRQMGRMVDSLRPELVVFVKYEFWFTLLDLLGKRQIPFVFVSAIFREDQYLFLRPFRSLLNRIFLADNIFVQNESSEKLLHAHGYYSAIIAGDTRIDRVIELSKQDFSWPELDRWKDDDICVVAGSTWPEGEAILNPTIPSFVGWKWIIAPHEITKDHMEKLKSLLSDKAVFLSDLGGLDVPIPSDKSVLVIDQIGLLSVLYRFGDIAYIGGGMGTGIHNTLEPAVYGLSLIFGPKFEKFQEAVDFYERGAARVVKSEDDMFRAFKYYQNLNRRQSVKNILADYFIEHSGATNRIMKIIESILSTV